MTGNPPIKQCRAALKARDAGPPRPVAYHLRADMPGSL